MSITDELRQYADKFYLFRYKTVGEELGAIADRIDKAHKHAIGYVDDRDPETMAESGWVRLPKDAYGEYIQPSDIPYLTKTNDGKRLAFCPPLELHQDGTWRLAGWETDRYRISKPTVEDVLWELLGDIRPDMEDEEAVPIVAAYAKRLNLADEVKEQQ